MASLSASAIFRAARSAGFNASESLVMTAIAFAESSGDPTAIGPKNGTNSNGTNDYGLWQINTVNSDALKMGDWRNPEDNARMARLIYKRQGYSAWTTYKNGSYKKHLGRGADGDASDESPSVPEKIIAGVPIVGGLVGVGRGVDDAVDAVQDKAGDVAGALPNPLEGVEAIAGVVVKIGQTVTSKSFWIRAGMGYLGFMLLMLGIVFLLASNKNVREVALGVATKGKSTGASAATAATKGAS